MKHHYKTKTFFLNVSNKFNGFRLLFFFITFGGLFCAYAQQSYTFTSAGASGRIGPTQGQTNAAYLSTNLNGSVVTTAGIQSFTIPIAGAYRVYALGAQGAGANGGNGAIMQGDFTFAANDVIRVVVGQQGVTQVGEPNACGGGGGSYVLKGTGNLVSNILVIAGGGGGSPATYSITRQASVGTAGNNGAGVDNTDGAGGTNGNGGNKSVAANSLDRGAGGGGFFTDGQSIGQSAGAANGGSSFINGSQGGSTNTTGADGGFGGGGAVWTTGFRGAGGGGGYSGGGGGQTNANVNTQCGGGGGSYNSGINQLNSISTATGDGLVIISALCNFSLTNASTTGPGPICLGNSATITTNAISNYAWSNGSSSSSVVVTPTVTTSYTLTATSPSNCTTSAVITITVNSGTPTVTAVSSSSAICAGQTVTLTASGANTYTWTGGATNGNAFIPVATSGYTVTGANACTSATAALSVTVNASPVVLAGVNNPTVCNGSSVTFTNGGNATSYVWTNGVTSGVPYVPGSSANYTLTGTANGCSSITVVGVTVYLTPTITPIATPTAICFGQTATLSATGASSYSWTPGTLLTSYSIVVSPPISTTYTLARSNGQCASTTTLGLVVNPLPLINASGTPNQFCAGTGVNLNVFGAITYTWLPGGFTTANFTLYPNNSTCYTVTGSNGNCTASSAVCVTVNPTPIISIFSSTNTICQGQNVSLTAFGGQSYTWQPTYSNGSALTISPPSTTIITVTGSNAFGCTGTQNQLILVNQVGSVNLNSSLPYVCAGQSAILSVTNPSPNVLYTWNTGPIGPSISVTPIFTTTYTAVGTDTTTGCSSSGSISLAVFISTFVITSPSQICLGQSATLTANGSATSYSWNVNGGIVSPSIAVSPLLTTIYTVIGLKGACQSFQTFTVIVHPLPNLTAVVAKQQICKFEIATITASGANTYSWNTNDTGPVLTYTLGVTTTYTVTGTDLYNCSKTTTVTQFVATCIGINEIGKNEVYLSVYPNPSNGSFLVSSETAITITVVNALGQLVSSINLSESNGKEVTVSGLAAGIYFISGGVGDKIINKKIIVER